MGEFSLRLEGGDSQKAVEIKVTDMYGKAVYHAAGTVFDTYRFGNAFAGGIYIAEVINGKNTQIVKLVKSN